MKFTTTKTGISTHTYMILTG